MSNATTNQFSEKSENSKGLVLLKKKPAKQAAR